MRYIIVQWRTGYRLQAHIDLKSLQSGEIAQFRFMQCKLLLNYELVSIIVLRVQNFYRPILIGYIN